MTQRVSVTQLAAMPTPGADQLLAGLSPLALQLLIAGSQHPEGRPNTLHSQNVDCGPELKELEARGLLRWIGRDPVVTHVGREAIDAPTEEQVRLAKYRLDHPWVDKLKQENGGTMPPAKTGDQIPNEVYRNYRTMNMVAVPIVRMQPELTVNHKVYASRDGSTRKRFFIDPKRMIDQPESRDDLVLTLIAKWLCMKISARFPGVNMLGVPRWRRAWRLAPTKGRFWGNEMGSRRARRGLGRKAGARSQALLQRSSGVFRRAGGGIPGWHA